MTKIPTLVLFFPCEQYAGLNHAIEINIGIFVSESTKNDRIDPRFFSIKYNVQPSSLDNPFRMFKNVQLLFKKLGGFSFSGLLHNRVNRAIKCLT